VKFKLKDDTVFSEQQMSSLTDIGGGGVRLHLPYQPQIGAHIAMQISFPPREKPIEVQGEVVHLQKTDNPRIYSVGIKFLSIDEDDRTYIIKRVNALTERKQSGLKAFFKSFFPK